MVSPQRPITTTIVVNHFIMETSILRDHDAANSHSRAPFTGQRGRFRAPCRPIQEFDGVDNGNRGMLSDLHDAPEISCRKSRARSR